MILIFKNNKYELTNSSTDLNLTPIEFGETSTNLSSFFVKTETAGTTCEYPQNIKNLFPRWVRLLDNNNSVLIALTEQYYNWLSCNCNDITDIRFFSLEELIDIEKIPDSLLKNLANSYLNAVPSESITSNLITPTGLRNLIENIKTNLYAKKGTEESVKLVINKAYGVPIKDISIGYPKKYLMRLNGGKFDWMRDNLNPNGEYSTTGYPQLSGSRLNFSVIGDQNIWQDYSYVINCSTLTQDQYTGVIRPLTHPSGFEDIFNYKPEIFNNSNNQAAAITIYEYPKIKNYAGYTLGANQTIGYTFGCISGYTAPYYVFPTWDVEISAYPAGVTFGGITLSDFFELRPLTGYPFPNELFDCTI